MNRHYSKYRAKPMVVDGIRFASTKESNRYKELKLLEKAGKIKDLDLQPPYEFYIKGNKVFTYKADFSYWDEFDNKRVEDVKGFRTPVYKLKKKIIEAYYSIKIEEV